MPADFWGAMFPNAHWGPMFPYADPAALSFFSGYGPTGAATIALNLEEALRISYKWSTDVIPTKSGREQRIATIDAPQAKISGVAKLSGNDPRAWRARLAKFAATGSKFMLGMPHEELIFQDKPNGYALPVGSPALALTDWVKRGQRALVMSPDGKASKECVVQDKIGSTVVIDKVLTGDLARYGCRIMPLMPVLLEPQQNSPRHAVNVERWEISAHLALFDYAPTLASIPIMIGGVASGAVATVRIFNGRGNLLSLILVHDPDTGAAGNLTEWYFTNGAVEITYSYRAGLTTLGDLQAALVNSSFFALTGTYDPATVIELGDAGTFQATGGATSGDVGTGAALTTYDGDGTTRPVWDVGVQLDGTAADAMHALTEIIDLGGVPYSIAGADQSHWGRGIVLRRASRAIWQWFKLFVWTCRGSQRAFWLPTWRNDLPFVSWEDIGGGVIAVTIRNDTGADIATWYPMQRQHVQIWQEGNVFTRAKIFAAINNSDGTYTLRMTAPPLTGAVKMISWLESCRFEGETIDVEFRGPLFSTSLVGRVVPT